MADDVRAAEAHAWMSKASEDLRAGRFVLGAEPPLTADAAFHAQQACEKAMKAFLAWHLSPFRKTHNLIELGEACAVLDPSLEPLLRRAAVLTEYAWRFRYPGEDESATPDEARKALGLAMEVFEAVRSQLP